MESKEKRIKFMKEELAFSNKFIVSNERQIIAIAQLVVPEDAISEDTNSRDYEIYHHSIPLDDRFYNWKFRLVVVQSRNKSLTKKFQARLTGKYFCYREDNEPKINFISLENPAEKSYIDLSPMFEGSQRL